MSSLLKFCAAAALLAGTDFLTLGIDLMAYSRGPAALGADKLDLVGIESALGLDKSAGLTDLTGLDVLGHYVDAFNNDLVLQGETSMTLPLAPRYLPLMTTTSSPFLT